MKLIKRKKINIGILIALAIFSLNACQSCKNLPKKIVIQDYLRSVFQKDTVFQNAWTGFVLNDAETGKTLFAHQADKNFVPASTTKILTTFYALQFLGDSLPAFEYAFSRDTLYIKGTGDPTFLHPNFEAWQAGFLFLKKAQKPIVLIEQTVKNGRLGLGWAWDDYQNYYSAEKTSFPIWGNAVNVSQEGKKTDLRSDIFGEPVFINADENRVVRAETANKLFIPHHLQETDFEQFISIFQPDAAKYLSSALGKNVATRKDSPRNLIFKKLYSCPTDTVLKSILYDSDNMLAEHVLMMVGNAISTPNESYLFDTEGTINILNSRAMLLNAPSKWVDGSGLSRNNLISPEQLAAVCLTLFHTQKREKLFDLFPAGGLEGTIQNWYKGKDGKPYIFAKSGSMSGVQCLSGYLVAKSGKILVFSFMHNNFTGSGTPYKQSMQSFLEHIYNFY